jgi:GNAT superfamily N-acetyltransferase
MDPETRTGAQEPPVRPQPDGSDIRKVTAADVPRVAEALADSFYDDPLMGWVIPDDSSRRERLQRGFDLWMRRIWLKHDECFTTDRLIGGALWMPPGTWHLRVPEQLRLVPAMIGAVGRNLPRLFRLLNAMESKHPHDPHFYLPVVGVEPQWQGKGFGGALMRPILERCDEQKVPAYLEATSVRSRALYERNGFEVVEEMRAAKTAPPLWRMWREPKGLPSST